MTIRKAGAFQQKTPHAMHNTTPPSAAILCSSSRPSVGQISVESCCPANSRSSAFRADNFEIFGPNRTSSRMNNGLVRVHLVRPWPLKGFQHIFHWTPYCTFTEQGTYWSTSTEFSQTSNGHHWFRLENTCSALEVVLIRQAILIIISSGQSAQNKSWD